MNNFEEVKQESITGQIGGMRNAEYIMRFAQSALYISQSIMHKELKLYKTGDNQPIGADRNEIKAPAFMFLGSPVLYLPTCFLQYPLYWF